MKTKKELIKIWKLNTKNTYKGINQYNALSSKEKSIIFDLILDGEIK